jgi:cysteine desulfurase
MSQAFFYLDYAATTPVSDEVLKEMLPLFSVNFGNAASSNHFFGWRAAEAVEIGRERVARFIGAETQEIIFTSGATEAINLAIKGLFEREGAVRNHIITFTTEHKAVLDTCQYLQKKGADLTILPVDINGHFSIDLLQSTITEKTLLVAAMWVNNETGIIHPVEQIAELTRPAGVYFFCDGTQAAGKISIDVKKAGIDMLCLSAHKIYGPKGVGALYISRKTPRVTIVPHIHGGGHERGLRSGTLNVPAIAGLGAACQSLTKNEILKEQKRVESIRNWWEERLQAQLNCFVNGGMGQRVSSISNICFPDTIPGRLISRCSQQLAVAAGSACTSGSHTNSHVLAAMGLQPRHTNKSIRFSLGRPTTAAEMESALDIVLEYAKQAC